jgi:hypothetical protein
LASEWNKLHPPQPDKDGKLQPVPFYSPDQPGDTETTSATNMAELGIKLSITARYSEAQRILDETVKTSIGPAMTSALRHPVNGWDGISTAQIYHAVTKKYLTLSIPQIRALKAELPLQFDSSKDFLTQAIALKAKLSKLARIGQPKSDDDAVEYLEEANRSNLAVMEACKAFHLARALSAKTPVGEGEEEATQFDLLVEYIVDVMPHITMSQSGYAGSMKASIPAPIYQTHMTSQEDAIARAYAEGYAAAVKKVADTSSNYCFVHGHTGNKGHLGEDCRTMLNEPTKYSIAMLCAKGPCKINGKNGSSHVHVPRNK